MQALNCKATLSKVKLSRLCTFAVQPPLKVDDKFSKDNSLQILAGGRGKDICSMYWQYYPPGLLGVDPPLWADNKNFPSQVPDEGAFYSKMMGKLGGFILNHCSKKNKD